MPAFSDASSPINNVDSFLAVCRASSIRTEAAENIVEIPNIADSLIFTGSIIDTTVSIQEAKEKKREPNGQPKDKKSLKSEKSDNGKAEKESTTPKREKMNSEGAFTV